MELWNLLGDIVVLLLASLLVGGLFARFGQSPIVGYLLAGMFLGGPGSLHLVGSEHEIEAIAELGVSLLLFSLGLEFSVRRLRRLGARPLFGGVLQIVCTIVAGGLAVMLCGYSLSASLAFAAIVSLSSTAVVLRILMERAEIEMPHGRNSLAVLLVQDVAVVPLAILMTILGTGGTFSGILADLARILAMAAGLIICLFLLTRIAVFALGTLTLHRNRELTVLFAVATGLGAAWAAHSVEVSPALGAFVAGMLLGSSPFATQIRADVSSLRVVLLTLFFGAAGMIANPIWIIENWALVSLVSLVIMVGKLCIVYGIFRCLGHSRRVAAATGLSLGQMGEFAFVLGGIGYANGAVGSDLYALLVSATIVSFFLSAFLVPVAPAFGNGIARWFSEPTPISSEDEELEQPVDVVIIGFGPAGELAAAPLVDSPLRVLVIDLNRHGVARARGLGFLAHVGDATQSEILEHAHISQAKIVIITVPDHRAALMILEKTRQKSPYTRIIVRCRSQRFTDEFLTAGAHSVIGDEEQVGQSMAHSVRLWMAGRELEEIIVPENMRST